MQDIILAQSNELTMSSREIAELTGKQVGHVHRDFKAMSVELDFPNDTFNKKLMPSPNMDLGFTYDHDDQGRIYCINLNRELTLTLVSGYSIKLRNTIIKRLQELEAKRHQIPQTYSAALLLAGQQAEQLEKQAEQLALAAPKVEFANTFSEATGNKTFRQVAKILKANEREFRAFLYNYKYMYQIGGGWTAHQKHVDAGRFHVSGGEANGHAFITCKFTPKGIEYIGGKWLMHTNLLIKE